MRPVRRLAERLRKIARVLDRERRGEDHHLREAMELARRQQQAPDARIDGQARELEAERGESALVVDGAQFEELAVPVLDLARRGRLDEGELRDGSQLERRHAQDHRGERGAQDLRRGELRALLEFLLREQADGDAARHAPAAPGALARRGLRDGLDAQLVDLLARRVALHAVEPGVDDEMDAGQGERGLGEVGGEDDYPVRAALEHAVLLLGGKAREERQDLDILRMVLPQRLGRLADLALAGKEDEDVAADARARKLVHGFRDRLAHVDRLVVVFLDFEEFRTVAYFDRIGAARDLDHRRAVEKLRDALGVDGGRGDNDLELRAHRHESLHVAQEEIDVEAPLVGLVDDDRVVGAQLAVRMRLGEEDSVGHHLHDGVGAGRVLEADLVADEALGRAGELLREAVGEASRRDAPRLRAADEACGAAPEREADLRDLRGLARARLAAHDGDRMVANERRDPVALLRDRQIFRKLRRGKAREPQSALFARALHQVGEQRLLTLRRPALPRTGLDGRDQPRDLLTIVGDRGGQDFGGQRGQAPFYFVEKWCQVRLMSELRRKSYLTPLFKLYLTPLFR